MFQEVRNDLQKKKDPNSSEFRLLQNTSSISPASESVTPKQKNDGWSALLALTPHISSMQVSATTVTSSVKWPDGLTIGIHSEDRAVLNQKLSAILSQNSDEAKGAYWHLSKRPGCLEAVRGIVGALEALEKNSTASDDMESVLSVRRNSVLNYNWLQKHLTKLNDILRATGVIARAVKNP